MPGQSLAKRVLISFQNTDACLLKCCLFHRYGTPRPGNFQLQVGAVFFLAATWTTTQAGIVGAPTVGYAAPTYPVPVAYAAPAAYAAAPAVGHASSAPVAARYRGPPASGPAPAVHLGPARYADPAPAPAGMSHYSGPPSAPAGSRYVGPALSPGYTSPAPAVAGRPAAVSTSYSTRTVHGPEEYAAPAASPPVVYGTPVDKVLDPRTLAAARVAYGPAAAIRAAPIGAAVGFPAGYYGR
ncbi:uncharacterized protein LOC144152454 [Haemaphysalis longicornis]